VSAKARFQRAANRYRKAEETMESARAELRAAMAEAQEEGVTLQAMADTLGVSRQRVYRILRGLG
jgi:exonuclease VII small subunit